MESATQQPVLQRLLGELNQLLWRQRSVMTEFVYRLEVQQLLLVNDRDRWMNLSVEEVERSLERIERHEGIQRRLLEELSGYLAVDAGSSLGDVCAVAPPPWDYIFEEHRAAFLVLIAEAEAASRDNQDLVRRNLDDIDQLMDRIGTTGPGGAPSAEAYGRDGSRGPRRPSGAMLLDREV